MKHEGSIPPGEDATEAIRRRRLAELDAGDGRPE